MIFNFQKNIAEFAGKNEMNVEETIKINVKTEDMVWNESMESQESIIYIYGRS